MAKIREIYASLAKLAEEIGEIEYQARFSEYSCDFKVDYDSDSPDDVQLYRNLYDIIEQLHKTKSTVDYLNKPIKKYTTLHKNCSDRYETEDGRELTCGSSIEYYGYDNYTEHNAWIESRIEHNGDDYYIVGDRELSLEGLRIRIR